VETALPTGTAVVLQSASWKQETPSSARPLGRAGRGSSLGPDWVYEDLNPGLPGSTRRRLGLPWFHVFPLLSTHRAFCQTELHTQFDTCKHPTNVLFFSVPIATTYSLFEIVDLLVLLGDFCSEIVNTVSGRLDVLGEVTDREISRVEALEGKLLLIGTHLRCGRSVVS
jgi:hypothetical protein